VTTTNILVVVAAVLIASSTQAVAGFGFGLLSVPIMTLSIDAKLAVVVSTIMAVCTATWQAWHGRKHADRVLVKRLTIAAYLGMPVGLWVFLVVSDTTLRLALGVAVLIAVVLLATKINLHHVGPVLDVGAGFVSGVLNTSLSTNGPPLVFALQARQLPPDRFRSTIAMVFAFSNVASLAMFFAAGKVNRDGLVLAAFAVPVMLFGQWAGLPLRRHFDPERFRWLVLTLLGVAAISAIVAALA
jgi:uncharacterized membrane protein YfcA